MNDVRPASAAPELTATEPTSAFLNYLPLILWQRRWLIIVPFVLIALIAIAIAVLAPARYQSSATVIVEAPDLPADLVSSSVTSVIDQRVAKIRQRVLSRPDLVSLIQRNNLYAVERRSQPLSAIIEKMRQDTTVEAISADVKQSGNSRTNTIAFQIAFDYSDPGKAQVVAQQYVNRFLELDSSEQTEQAVNVAGFLQQQADALTSKINQIEQQITSIKASNGAVLAAGSGMGMMIDPGTIDSQIQSLQMQNAQLASQSGGSGSSVGLAQRALTEALGRYSDDHPDVKLARQRLAEAKREAGAVSPEDQQIRANRARISELIRERGAASARVNSNFAAQARAPGINAQVQQLENQAEDLRSQYGGIAQKLMIAQNSARMEQEQKGERLTVADPPVVPEKPIWPNRIMLVLSGLLLGAASGVGLALLMEMIRRPVRGTGAIQEVLGVLPLVVIPVLREKPTLIQRIVHRMRRGS